MENLHVQKLIPKSAVETLHMTIYAETQFSAMREPL